VPWTASYCNDEKNLTKAVRFSSGTCDSCVLDGSSFTHACDQNPEPKVDDDGGGGGGEGGEGTLELFRIIGQEGRVEGGEGAGGDHEVAAHVAAYVREEEASWMERTYVNDAAVMIGNEKEGGPYLKQRRMTRTRRRKGEGLRRAVDCRREHSKRTYIHLPTEEPTRIIEKKVLGLCDHLHVAFDPVSVHMATFSKLLPLFHHSLGDSVRRLLLLVYDVRILAVSAHPSTVSFILCNLGQWRPQKLSPVLSQDLEGEGKLTYASTTLVDTHSSLAVLFQ
jgi:hypothetical protein